MKKGIKWLLGILIGLVAVAILAGGAILVLNRWNHGGGQVGNQSYRFRSGGPMMPWRNFLQPGTPPNPAPQYRMPMMRPFWGISQGRLGIFNPFRFIFLCLICIGFLVLLVLGIVYLISPKKPSSARTTPAVQVVVPAATPAVSQPVDEAAHVCPHCGRQVQQDWSHCPYCGAPLTAL